jgi:hypothetical protein
MKMVMMFVLFCVLAGCSDQPVQKCDPDTQDNCPASRPTREVGRHQN